MAYTITQTCCQDASCIAVCPVNCIHPAPGEPDFGSTDSLYIDPRTCIDCGACADECPVDAVVPEDTLTDRQQVYAGQARAYYRGRTAEPAWSEPEIPPSLPFGAGPLRVAVVGSGPAACYTAQELLQCAGAEVTMIERLPVPGGLLRYGVAPDHPATKKLGERHETLFQHPKLALFLNVEVGAHLTQEDLTAHHHAVVYAVGAAEPRRLDIPGEDLPGSIPAPRLVAWYNGHPDVPADAVDLAGVRRAVVIGNGNVALDIARLLACDPEPLARTDMADHALVALRRSRIREVVLLGRRGPLDAALTWPELHALTQLPGVSVELADHPDLAGALAAAPASVDRTAVAELLRGLPITDASVAPAEGTVRILLQFFASPAALHGDERVTGLRTASGAVIEAELVVSAIGYRGTPLPGLPFDGTRGTVPHRQGRIVDPDTGLPVPGAYAVGWVKRGPNGGIGANRADAKETAAALIADAGAGLLPEPAGGAKEFARLLRRRRPEALTGREAAAIDRAERERGAAADRPRVKFVTVEQLLAASRKRVMV